MILNETYEIFIPMLIGGAIISFPIWLITFFLLLLPYPYVDYDAYIDLMHHKMHIQQIYNLQKQKSATKRKDNLRNKTYYQWKTAFYVYCLHVRTYVAFLYAPRLQHTDSLSGAFKWSIGDILCGAHVVTVIT